MRLRSGLPTLRQKRAAAIVFDAFRAAKTRWGARLVQFSVQSNHIHLLVEANDKESLAQAMKGLAQRLARRLNRYFKRKGNLFADRYHEHILRTPLEVRRTIRYVLRNHLKHAARASRPPLVDPMSTARYFDGFTTPPFRRARDGCNLADDPPVAPPSTWLLRTGWRRLGLIAPNEVPAKTKGGA
ncbi:MAG TPA: transposase [Polyangiaceae bacterium]|jgi:REP element-mobilizing transposase RayT|nr:transposase [Polyangiaceae bacterium]